MLVLLKFTCAGMEAVTQALSNPMEGMGNEGEAGDREDEDGNGVEGTKYG